jgi:hypothetical protein
LAPAVATKVDLATSAAGVVAVQAVAVAVQVEDANFKFGQNSDKKEKKVRLS